MSTASSVVSVDETTLAITSSLRSGNMTDKWRLMVWESSHGWEYCPGTSWSDWPMDDDGAGMSRSCWAMDDDDGPERSWSGSVMSTVAIFAFFG